MTRKLNWFVILTALLALFAMGCGDDDDSGTGPDNGNGSVPINLSSAAIQLPQGVSDAASAGNIGAQQTQLYTQLLNTFTAYSFFYVPPATAAKITQGGSYSWSAEGVTVTMTWTENETQYMWNVVVDGNDGQTEYDNFTLLEGVQSKGDPEGSLDIYDPDTPGGPVFFWNWITSQSGVFTSTFTDPTGNETVTASVNPDGSGTLEYVDNGVTRFESTWTSAGSGTWTSYDSGGQQDGTGSWNPPD